MRATTTRPTGNGGHRNKGALAHPRAPPCAKTCRGCAQNVSRMRPKRVADAPKTCRGCAQNVSRMRPKRVFLYTKPPKPPNFGHIGAIGFSEGIPERRHEFRSPSSWGNPPPAAATLRDRSAPPRWQGHRPPLSPLGRWGNYISNEPLGRSAGRDFTAPRSTHRMP